MEEISKELNWEEPREMFILGYLHDIGRKWQGRNDEHEKIGAEELKKSGYKYWQEVREHSQFNEYRSEELDLLNFADMSVDKDGNIVPMQDRIKDFRNRYGNEIEKWLERNKKELERLESKFGKIRDKILRKES